MAIVPVPSPTDKKAGAMRKRSAGVGQNKRMADWQSALARDIDEFQSERSRQDVIDWMDAHKGNSIKLLQVIHSGVLDATASETAGCRNFPASYTRLRHLSKTYMASELCAWVPGLSIVDLRDIVKFNPNDILEVYVMALGEEKNGKIYDRSVRAHSIHAQAIYEAMGNRLHHLPTYLTPGCDKLPWARIGFFRLVIQVADGQFKHEIAEGEFWTHIVHISGKHIAFPPPLRALMDNKVVIEDNNLETSARIYNRDTKFSVVCKDFFNVDGQATPLKTTLTVNDIEEKKKHIVEKRAKEWDATDCDLEGLDEASTATSSVAPSPASVAKAPVTQHQGLLPRRKSRRTT